MKTLSQDDIGIAIREAVKAYTLAEENLSSATDEDAAEAAKTWSISLHKLGLLRNATEGFLSESENGKEEEYSEKIDEFLTALTDSGIYGEAISSVASDIKEDLNS